MKNSIDTIEKRTRDLPACSTVPQPPKLPRPTNICNRQDICGDVNWFLIENYMKRNVVLLI